MSLLRILFVGALVYAGYASSNTDSTVAKPAPALHYDKTPEQVASERAFQRTVRLAAGVKAALRDPSSLEWESIHANEDATVACFAYRAKNGFGGMGREFVVFSAGKASQKPADWNKRCAGDSLLDMKHVAFAI